LRNAKHISIDYTAGYATIPLDIQKIVCDETVRSWNGDDVSGNVTSWKLGNASESVTGNDVDMESGFLMKNYNYLVNNYKDISIID